MTNKNARFAAVQAAFTPHAPIDDADHFANRPDQVQACIRALVQRGLHIVLWGERGVGKTSLATVLPGLLRGFKSVHVDGVRVDCSTVTTFRAIWRSVFRELNIEARELDSGEFSPEDVRFYLQKEKRQLLIVIDELDRMEGEDPETARSLLADTLKTLSDNGVNATIMLVGVADTLVELLGEHASVVRSLIQVPMPRMDADESGAIIDKGFARTDLRITPEARTRIIQLSEGLPHFVHLIALHAGELAVQNDDQEVSLRDVNDSLANAVRAHSLAVEYDEATRSPQKANLYERVLLACAYAPRDSLGYFRPISVVAPLSVILGREVDIATFQTHLSELSGRRSQTLKREGTERNFRFRFRNPLLQAFAKIRAISTGLIDEAKRIQLDKLSATTAGPRGLGPLFG
jgi:Cdc6-like AAA superfamily ATPase